MEYGRSEEFMLVFTFPSICKGPCVATGVGPLSQVALKMVGFREGKEWSLALEMPRMMAGFGEHGYSKLVPMSSGAKAELPG